MQLSYVVLAIPFFFLLIGAESVVLRLQSNRPGRRQDLLSNLGCGMLQQLSQALVRTATFGAYVWVYEHLRVFSIANEPWAWGACFVADDFVQYWYHRAGHRVAAFWAVHEVHHQSEDLDFSTSLRVSAFDYYNWMFDLVLAVAGFPPGMFLAVSAAVSLYGFTSHTRTVGRLGPLEWLLVTPSHHRVHHGSNLAYLDCNYGKVLIVWDRLLGTFVPETEAPVYGLTTPLRSQDPLWANVHAVHALTARARSMPSRWDRFQAPFRPPSWMGSSSTQVATSDDRKGVSSAEAPAQRAELVLFLAALAATLAVLAFRPDLSTAQICAAAALIAAALGLVGRRMDTALPAPDADAPDARTEA
jgi:alkylglycerol monooxygenase